MTLFDEVAEHLDWPKIWEAIGGTGNTLQRFSDGQQLGCIMVQFLKDGDAWIQQTLEDPEFGRTPTRFRKPTLRVVVSLSESERHLCFWHWQLWWTMKNVRKTEHNSK